MKGYLVRLSANQKSADTPKESTFRSVYRFTLLSPLCFGVPHHPPDLRAKVAEEFGEFRFAGTTVGARYTPQGKTQFARVSDEKDWAYVRQIDEALTRLLEGQ